jgi:two-component system chemotaxis response regulator CheB
MIKVLIVDDSSFTRKLLKEMLTSDPEIEVIGEAADGQEAVEKVHALNPDVVTMDIIMPVSDGIWALEEVMKQKPTPVIMVSSISQLGSDIVEIAYSLGVIDVVLKPKNPQSIGLVGEELIQKIKAVAKIDRERLLSYSSLIKSPNLIRGLKLKASTVVAIGSSAGGLLSLTEVLSVLPEEFSAGIIIAQHIPHQFLIHFVERVKTLIPFYIRIAQKGDMVFQKSILFSPGDSSVSAVRTKKGMVVNLVNTERKLQPDIDEVFSACAAAFGKNTVGVVLSGMGRDGTKGAEEIRRVGGVVIAEDKSTAGIFGMPRAVIEAHLADYILPSSCITEVVIDLISGKQPLITSKEVLLVKGVTLKACVDYIREKLGDAKIKEALSLFRDPFISETKALSLNRFYSGEFFRELCGRAAQCHGETFLEEMGRRMAQTDMSVHKDTLFGKAGQIADCVHAIPEIVALDFRGMRARISGYTGSNRYMVLVLGGPAFSSEGIAAIISSATIGWIKELFSRHGVRDVMAGCKVKRDAQDKPYLEFYLQWE